MDQKGTKDTGCDNGYAQLCTADQNNLFCRNGNTFKMFYRRFEVNSKPVQFNSKLTPVTELCEISLLPCKYFSITATYCWQEG